MSFIPSKIYTLSTAATSVLLLSLASLSAFGETPTVKSGMPITFEQNQGQAPSDVKFVARGKSGILFLSPTEIDLRAPGKASQFRLKLRGSSATTSLLGTGGSTGVANYFHGNDPSAWLKNIPSFSQVTYKNVYPKIDLVVYGNHRQFESDFVIGRDADPSAISLQIDGKLDLRQDGSLAVESADGALELHRPFVYQVASNGERQAVDCHYTISNKNEVAFALGTYDHSRQLVIDPIIDVSTYFGGGVQDTIYGIAGDANSNVYVVGQTSSANFPTTPGVKQPTKAGLAATTASTGPNPDPAYDCFVAKFSFTGQLLYSTYVGGSAFDKCSSVAVNANGEAFVGGTSQSNDFPMKSAYQGSLKGTQNGILFHLDANGANLVFSTYLGGGGEFITSTAVDTNSNVYVAGVTNSSSYPTTTGAYQAAFPGTLVTDNTVTPPKTYYNNSGFLSKLPADGSKLIYSTYLGAASGDTAINGLGVDPTGSAYVGGETHSAGFPITAGAYQTTLGAGAAANAFVTKFSTDGTSLVYSTFIGGTFSDSGRALAVDSLGNAYLAGYTQSTDFPTKNALQTSAQGVLSAFALKLNPAGDTLVYSTYLAGSNSVPYGAGKGYQTAFGVAVDFFGNAAFTGETSSDGFPVTSSSAPQSAYGGGALDAFVTCFSPSGSEIFSTYVGGSGDDYGFAILADPYGYFWIAGQTTSPNLLVPHAIQPLLATASNPAIPVLNGFLTRINYTDVASATTTATLSPTSLSFGNQNVNTVSAAQTITVTNGGAAAIGITSITITGTNKGDFAIASNNCGSSVASGGTCTISVTFDPSATGPRSATLAINGTSSESVSASLTGTGTAPTVSLSGTGSYIFANQNVNTTSAPVAFTVTNPSGPFSGPLTISSVGLTGATADFTATSNSTCKSGTVVAVGSSCTIYVTFNPVAVNTFNANLVITDNAAASTQSISLSGTGIGVPNLAVSPMSLTFGNQVVGSTSAAQTVTLTNTGTATLNITNYAFGGAAPADFVLDTGSTTCTGTLAMGASCKAGIAFKPTATGTRAASASVTDNAPGTAPSITLSGTGTAAAAPVVTLSYTSLTFGGQNVGTSSPSQAITIKNTGNAPLVISSVVLSGANAGDFALSCGCTGTLAVNASCTLTVVFKPTATGTRTANIVITDNAAGSPQSIALTGTGTAPAVTLSPTSINFGTVACGKSSAPQTVKVSNTGTGPLTITSIGLHAHTSCSFQITATTCGTSLAAGSSCTVTLVYKPFLLSQETTTLIVSDNAAGSPQTVTLIGK